MSPLEDFLSHYGLLALLLLATIEGDVSLLVAGVLSHAGVLSLPGTILAGAAGNLVGDIVWFILGRTYRERIRSSRLYRSVGSRIERLAAKLGPWQLIAARLVYGTRNASMVFWGQLHLAWARFLLIDAFGCLLIATGFALLGSLVGHGTTALAGEVKRIEHWLLVAVIGGAAIVWAVSQLTRRKLGD